MAARLGLLIAAASGLLAFLRGRRGATGLLRQDERTATVREGSDHALVGLQVEHRHVGHALVRTMECPLDAPRAARLLPDAEVRSDPGLAGTSRLNDDRVHGKVDRWAYVGPARFLRGRLGGHEDVTGRPRRELVEARQRDPEGVLRVRVEGQVGDEAARYVLGLVGVGPLLAAVLGDEDVAATGADRVGVAFRVSWRERYRTNGLAGGELGALLVPC